MFINIWFVLVLFMALLALRVPVAIALLAPVVVYTLAGGALPPLSLPVVLTSGTGSFLLLTIPMFILMAEVMNRSNITTYLFDFASSMVGHLRGSLAHVNVVTSLIFAGMSGSALADISGLGRIQVQAMKLAGFSTAFAGAITVASATIGPILPPSIIMVVYAAAAEVSIGAMFMAGVIPAFLLAGLLMLSIYLLSLQHPEWMRSERRPWADRVRAGGMALPALLAPVILLGGFLSGVWTPTEAGAVASIYSFFIAVVIYRALSPSAVVEIIVRTVTSSANILLIFACAHVLSRIIALEGVPEEVAGLLAELTQNPLMILLLINIVFLIGGMFFEPTPFLLVATPVLVSIAQVYDFDLIHIGIVCIVNLMLGNMTPPFAIGLFAVAEVTGASFASLVRASLPFYCTFAALLIVITYVPALSLTLPQWVFG